MSDYLAIGGVSAVLKSLLGDALSQGGPATILGSTSAITNTSPDLIVTGPDEAAQINLFMYYASINPSLRNLGLPSQDAGGNRVANPPLAINLHYLVTTYGAAQYDPEILLAWAMQVFHNTPVVPRAVIEQALADLTSAHPATPQQSLIATTNLASQVEQIRITPETLTTEEIYRLWAAFSTSYRPTTSYQVSVVVIQDTQAYTANLPVQRRSVMALPLVSPVLDQVTPPMVATGEVLTVTGSSLLGNSAAETTISFDGADAISAATVQGNVVRVNAPASLFAGVHTLRAIRTVTFETSDRVHSGFSSNPIAFQLLPTVTPAGGPPLSVAQGSVLTLTLTPPVSRLQTVVVFFGDQAIPLPTPPSTAPDTSSTIAVTVPASVGAATYPLRVAVDGAQSRLQRDVTVGSPTYGQWLPQVKVTA